MASGILEEMTIEQVREFKPEVVVVGISSTEPHGEALPYGTDFFQGDAIVRRAVPAANAQGARALMYPTLPIGNNVNFKAWPFACRIKVQTLIQVILDIIEALEQDGIRKVVLFNSHGGNTDTIRAALRAHADRRSPGEGAFVCMASNMGSNVAAEVIAHPSDHGGEFETSAVMYLRPELVAEDKLTDNPFGELAVEALADSDVYFVKPWHLHVPASAGGEQRESTAEKGEKIIAIGVESLTKLLVELSAAKMTGHFPFKPNES